MTSKYQEMLREENDRLVLELAAADARIEELEAALKTADLNSAQESKHD